MGDYSKLPGSQLALAVTAQHSDRWNRLWFYTALRVSAPKSSWKTDKSVLGAVVEAVS